MNPPSSPKSVEVPEAAVEAIAELHRPGGSYAAGFLFMERVKQQARDDLTAALPSIEQAVEERVRERLLSDEAVEAVALHQLQVQNTGSRYAPLNLDGLSEMDRACRRGVARHSLSRALGAIREPTANEWCCDSCGALAAADAPLWEQTGPDDVGVTVERCPECRLNHSQDLEEPVCNCSPGLPMTGDYGKYTTAACPVHHPAEDPDMEKAVEALEADTHLELVGVEAEEAIHIIEPFMRADERAKVLEEVREKLTGAHFLENLRQAPATRPAAPSSERDALAVLIDAALSPDAATPPQHPVDGERFEEAVEAMDSELADQLGRSEVDTAALLRAAHRLDESPSPAPSWKPRALDAEARAAKAVGKHERFVARIKGRIIALEAEQASCCGATTLRELRSLVAESPSQGERLLQESWRGEEGDDEEAIDPAELAERAKDPAFKARLKRSIEENRELLDRLGCPGCEECGGSREIPTGECRAAMSGPTCRNPACPPCQTPETAPCPDCKDGEEEDWPPELWVAVGQDGVEEINWGEEKPDPGMRRYIPAPVSADEEGGR
jgi:hypothetical protein